LNKNLKELYCVGNQLTYLPSLNKNLQKLYCMNNDLTSLPSLNENLQKIYCTYNQLTSLPSLNKNLQLLHCSFNQLTSLPSLNENLQILYCNNNILTSLPYLNENLKELWCVYNPVYKIIGNITRIYEITPIYVYKKKIQTINNFRYLYWCLYFKKQLRKWLWEKIREPKIMKKYHPSYLLKNMQEDIDLDIILNNWV
jgi:hypothetical protein